MSRLSTMSRFEEHNKEEKEVSTCHYCEELLYKGMYVYLYDEEKFCSRDCIINYINPHSEIL